MKNFKKEWALFAPSIKWLLLTIVGVWLFGEALMIGINVFVDSANTYFPMGLVLTSTVVPIICLITQTGNLCIYFNLAVSNGRTRKSFLLWSSVVHFVQTLLCLIPVALCALASMGLSMWLEPVLPMDMDGTEFLQGIASVWYVIPLAPLALVLVSICVGALFKRFGRTAFWFFWALYMGGIFFGSSAIDFLSSNTAAVGFLGNMQALLAPISVVGWVIIAAVVFLAFFSYCVWLWLHASVDK